MLGRLVNEKIAQTSYTYPWGNVLPLLKKNDLNIINLETTLTTSTDKVPKVFNFKSDPNNIQTLVDGNISAVCIANNHIGDFGNQGLLETISTLDHAGIKHVGAGKNLDEARGPVILEKNGIKIGIIGFTDNEPYWQATENKPGTFYIKIGNPKALGTLTEIIQNLKKQVDIVVVSTHWGPNKRVRPTQAFIDFAHALIDAGVDIFHGHSAHIFQGIEIYKNKLIMYDTGDFIDDYAIYPHLRNDQSFLFLVTVDKSGIKQIQLIPMLISNMQVNQATSQDFVQTVERIQHLSQEFGTQIIEQDEKILVSIN
jgi:poly-gamma-glutamate synthesis protein (capsule biosynthesis protein)